MSRRSKSRSESASFADETRKNLPAQARQLVAHARNDITIPYYSGAMQNADDTLIQRGGGKGLKIYDEIERDTHAWAMLQKRKKVLVARSWEVMPASDAAADVAAADLVRTCLTALPFDRITEELLDATLKGYAVSEIIWARRGNQIVPKELVTHDQRRFTFDEDWRPRLLTFTSMRDGEELPERKFVVHRFGVKGNNPFGLGLGSRLFWPVLFKREGIAFWLHFLDKFAGPTVVGTTPYGTITEEQQRFLNTLKSVRTAGAIAMPVGSDVKFLEAARGGNVAYQEFLAYWDKQISICVTGETLTTDVGKVGSLAASQTHADMLAMLVDSDGDLLSDSLRQQLLTWIVEYNMPGAQVPMLHRVRPANDREDAEVGLARANATSATNKALREVLSTAANLEDDRLAEDFVRASGLVDGMESPVVAHLVANRASFGGGTPPQPALATEDPALNFAAPLKKNSTGTVTTPALPPKMIRSPA
jgi:phage gp29-like protein